MREFLEGHYEFCDEPKELFNDPEVPLVRIFKSDHIGDEVYLDSRTGDVYWEGQRGWWVRRETR